MFKGFEMVEPDVEVVGELTIIFRGPSTAAETAEEEPGAFLSNAPASLCRAPGTCESQQGTEQKEYPVRWPLHVETLQM